MSSVRYGLGVLRTCAEYRLSKRGLRHYDYLDLDPARALAGLPAPREVTEPAPEEAGSGAPAPTS
jgi:hypothetical protein